MVSESERKVELSPTLFFSIFYVIVGVALFFLMAVTGFTSPPHLPVLAFLSLVAAYGLFRMRRWSVWMVIIVFFLGITFGVTTLYNSIVIQSLEEPLLFHGALLGYLLVVTAAFIYVIAKRDVFEPA